MTDSAAAPAPAGAPSPNDCLLTLSLPVALEEEVLDALLADPELAVGFTLLQGYGMGTRVHLASAMEQVRGRARRSFVQIALPRERVPALIDMLQAEMSDAGITWWVVPLLGFGRLGVQHA